MLHELNKICRTCLEKSENLFSIYDGDENRVVEMLEYILDTSLKTPTTDELPENVCHQCVIDIGRCFTFKMKCNNSYEILRNLLDKRKEQPEISMQIKRESGATTDESPTQSQELSEVQPALAEIRIKEEPTDWQRKQLPNQMRLRRKGIVPTTSNLSTNNLVDIEHREHYTVQYSIVEVTEAQDLTDQLQLPPITIDVDVNIRHCASCGAGFAEEKELYKHLEDCQASTPSKPSKPSKSDKYSNSKRHKCPYCDKSFPRPCRLRNHLRVHSGESLPNEESHTCQHCNESFSLLISLKHHLSTHKGENPLKCSYCGQVFKKRFNLNRHLRYHTDAKKHQCKKCDRTFLWVSNLKRHMLYHNACHSYVCELCSKEYAHKYLLQEHILTHNDEKPFKCKFCGNGFTREYNRNIHQRRHMENRL